MCPCASSRSLLWMRLNRSPFPSRKQRLQLRCEERQKFCIFEFLVIRRELLKIEKNKLGCVVDPLLDVLVFSRPTHKLLENLNCRLVGCYSLLRRLQHKDSRGET